MANGRTVSPQIRWPKLSETNRFFYALGTLERRERNFESAEALFMEAQNKWLGYGGSIRTDPFNGAMMYKIGCTTLDQGKVEAAV